VIVGDNRSSQGERFRDAQTPRRVDERAPTGRGAEADPARESSPRGGRATEYPPPCGMLEWVCSGSFPQKRITALVLDVPEGPERKDRCLPGDESPQDKGVFGPESQIPHAVQLDGVRTREELDHHATSSKTPPRTPSSGTR
jgi:hypothetical protein